MTRLSRIYKGTLCSSFPSLSLKQRGSTTTPATMRRLSLWERLSETSGKLKKFVGDHLREVGSDKAEL